VENTLEAFRRDGAAQNIELNLIAIGGETLRNSASGGFTLRGEKIANDKCLDELLDEGIYPVLVGDQVLSISITKDIAREAIGGGIAYSDETAGPAPRLEHHLRKCANKIIRDYVDVDTFTYLLEVPGGGERFYGDSGRTAIQPPIIGGNIQWTTPERMEVLSFLTKLAYLVAVPHLVAFAKPPTQGSRLNSLMRLKRKIDFSMDQTGLSRLIEIARTDLKARIQEYSSECTKAAMACQAAANPDMHEASQKAKLEKMEAGRKQRKAQVDGLVGRFLMNERQGIQESVLELPIGLYPSISDMKHLLLSRQAVLPCTFKMYALK
ncbi:hypothetical protein BGX29_002971, partial [Mortierella sp. GBA35]